MILGGARTHGLLTKTWSLPREQPLVFMSGSLSACQGGKKPNEPCRRAGVGVNAAATASCPKTRPGASNVSKNSNRGFAKIFKYTFKI